MSIIGTKVQARWGSEGKLYGATITAINSDGTVKLLWEAKSAGGKNLVTSKVKMEHIIVPDVMAVENDTIDDVGASTWCGISYSNIAQNLAHITHQPTPADYHLPRTFQPRFHPSSITHHSSTMSAANGWPHPTTHHQLVTCSEKRATLATISATRGLPLAESPGPAAVHGHRSSVHGHRATSFAFHLHISLRARVLAGRVFTHSVLRTRTHPHRKLFETDRQATGRVSKLGIVATLIRRRNASMPPIDLPRLSIRSAVRWLAASYVRSRAVTT